MMVEVHAHIVFLHADIQSISSGLQVHTVHGFVCFCHLKAWYHRPVSAWLQVQNKQAFLIYSRGDSAKDDIGQITDFKLQYK